MSKSALLVEDNSSHVVLIADELSAVLGDWTLHSRRASEIAREHFDARVVLPRLIDIASR